MDIKTDSWETTKGTRKNLENLLDNENVLILGIIAMLIIKPTHYVFHWILLIILLSTIPMRISLHKWKKKQSKSSNN